MAKKETYMKIKGIIDDYLTNKDPYSLFDSTNDPFMLSEVNKTSVSYWFRLLDIFSGKMKVFNDDYFVDRVQVKEFSKNVKPKIIFLLKMLVYILRNTFNHEVYVIDPNISNFLYSNDLDVAYHSYLYFNEYNVHEISLMNLYSFKYMMDIDLSLYNEKKYRFDKPFNDHGFDLTYEFNGEKFNGIMMEIRKIIDDANSTRKSLNFFEIKEKIEGFSIQHADILRFEWYKKNQLEILLAIEILASSINQKIFKIDNYDAFILSIKYFFKTENLYLSESMRICKSYILSIFTKKEYFVPENKYANFLMSTDIENEFIESKSSNESSNHVNKMLKIFLVFYKSRFEPNLNNLFLLKINFQNVSFSDMNIYLPFILYDSSIFELYLQNINFIKVYHLIENFSIFLTPINKCENLDRTLSVQMSYINTYEETILYWVNFFDLIRYHIYSRDDLNGLFIEKNMEYIQNLFISMTDHNVIPGYLRDKIFAILFNNSTEKLNPNSLTSMEFLEQIYDHFKSDDLVASIVTLKNLLSFCNLVVKNQLLACFPSILNRILEFYSLNIEISLIFYYFYNIYEDLKSQVSNIAGSFESINLDLRLLKKYLLLKDREQIDNMKMFNFKKKINNWDKFTKSLHEYLKQNKKEFCVDFYIYHDFFLHNLLRLIEYILTFENITVTNWDREYLVSLFKRDNDLFFSTNILLIWNISRRICEANLEYMYVEFFVREFMNFFEEYDATAIFKEENHLVEVHNDHDFFCFLYTMFFSFQFLQDYIDYNQKIIQNRNLMNFELIKLIKKAYFYVYKKEYFLKLQKESDIISKGIVNRQIYDIYESSDKIETIMGKISYLIILKTMSKIPLDEFLVNVVKPTKRLFLYCFYDILDMNMGYDENLLYIFNLCILEFESAIFFNNFKECVRLLDVILEKNIVFDSKTNLDTENSISIFFEILYNLMNKFDDKNESVVLDALEIIIEFMCSNTKYISCESFKGFFNMKILGLKMIENCLSRENIFNNILNLINKIDHKSENSFLTGSKIQENTLLLDFLENVICKLKCNNFFIATQKKYITFFLFIHKKINTYDSISAHGFRKDTPRSNILNLYITNIDIMISKKHNMSYKKEALFVTDLDTCLTCPREIYMYLISLLRLSEYTRSFTKKDVYNYFDIKRIFEFIQRYNKEVKKEGSDFLSYIFSYLDEIFEDDFFFVEKMSYIVNLNKKIQNCFLHYISTRLDTINVKKKSVEHYELILRSEIDLKIIIVADILKCISDNYLNSIMFLQFLNELLFKYPFLVFTIHKSDIHNLFNKFGIFEEISDKISSSNQEFWCLNFYYGYFIAIIFYRGSLDFISELIFEFCNNLQTYNTEPDFFSHLSLIHRIILSEICCCEYTCYKYMFINSAHEKKCAHVFKERRKDIIRNFLKNDIFSILLSGYTKFDKNTNIHFNLLSYIIKLTDIFISFCQNENIEFNNKCVIRNPFFVASCVPLKVFIPRILEELKNIKISRLEANITTGCISYKHVLVKEIMDSACLDFGYASGFDMISKNISSYSEFLFFEESLKSITNNFTYIVMQRYNSYTSECDVNSNEKVICVNKLKKRLYFINRYKFTLFIQIDNTDATQKASNFQDKEKFDYLLYFKKYCSKNITINKSRNADVSRIKNHKKNQISVLFTEELCTYLFFYFSVFGREYYSMKKICIIKKVIQLFFTEEFKNRFVVLFSENFEKRKYLTADEDALNILININKFLLNIKKFDIVFFKSDVFDILLFELISVTKKQILYLNIFFEKIMPVDTLLSENCSNTCSTEMKTVKFLTELKAHMEKTTGGNNVFFASQIMLFYIKKMEYNIFFSILQLKNQTKYEPNKDFGTAFDITLSFFDYINLYIPTEYIQWLVFFYFRISNCDLFYFYNRKIVWGSPVLEELFQKYFKILLVLNKSYHRFKTIKYDDGIFHNEISRYDDFLCLVYKIASNRIVENNKEFYDHVYSESIIELKMDFLIRNMHKLKDPYEKNISLLFEYVSLTTKQAYIYEKIYINSLLGGEEIYFNVNRTDLSNNIVTLFDNYDNDTLKVNNWEIMFTSEIGTGLGPTLEFFTLVGTSINQNKYFEMFKSKESFYTNEYDMKPEEIEKLYYYTGIIIAKSIVYNTTLGLEFIESFYLYLTKDNFTVEDLKVCDSELYSNLIYLRTVENLSLLDFNFTFDRSNNGVIETIELVENGKNILVTGDNLEEYLQKITKLKLFKGMTRYLEKMKEGFRFILDNGYCYLFNYKELMSLVQGIADFEVEDFKKYAFYISDYNKDHLVIIWFWNYMSSLEYIEKKKLFFFLTGCEKIPFGGFKSQKFLTYKFTIMPISNSELLPSVQTCSNLLKLPMYKSEEILRKKFEMSLDSLTYELD